MQVKDLAQKKYNYTFSNEPVSPYVTALYDAVLLYSIALNKTLEQGGQISNGSEISRLMWNRTFEGKNCIF